MNRIYQGRVTKVEIPGNSADWQSHEDGESLLWKHHELFQDAVNYYLLALLALAIDPVNPATAIRKQMADPESELQVWTSFRRRSQTRSGMQSSAAKYLGLRNPKPTLDECFESVLSGNVTDPVVLDLALQELLEECNGDGAIQQEGRSMFPRFCSPSYKGDYPQSTTAKDKKSAKEWLPAFLYAAQTPSDLKAVRQRLKFELFANRDLTGRTLDAAESRKRLTEMLSWLTARHTALASEKDRLQKIIDKLPDSFQLPAWRGGSVNKEALQQRFYAWLIFDQVESSTVTFSVLRDSFPVPKEKRKTTGEPAPVGKLSVALSDDPIKLARGKRGYVFRAFTSLPCWGTDDPNQITWKEFDVAAFKEALKALHQIESKGEEREKERERLLQRHAFMRGTLKTWKSLSDTEENEPDVLAGDPRVERLEQILNTDLAAEYEMSEGEKVDYGLQPRTIRGFRDLKREWNKIVKPGDSFTEQKKNDLITVLRVYQKENPNIIGSVRLYEELVKNENWLIWREMEAETTLEEWTKQKFASDPLEALTEERQLLRDIERLKQPIKFTPADPIYSRRQFYFSDMTDLSTKNRFDAQKQTMEVPIAIRQEGHWKQQSVKIHFSAPRAVRDHLIDEASEDSQVARWQQPMMEALNLSLTLTNKKGEASLSDCTAVALMPEELASGNRHILLNFPITLETDTLVKALGKAECWDGQFAAFGEDNFYLRWPKDKWPAGKESNAWYHRLNGFDLLSVDLGQRDAGAFAVIRASKEKPTATASRFIGEAAGCKWHTTVPAMGALRLPGEDALVFRDGQWQEELYGERGRSADPSEWTEARQMCEALGLVPDDTLGTNPKWFSFPELNDRLLFTIRRAQSRLARLQSWSWMIADEARRENIREALINADEDELSLKESAKRSLWPILSEKLANEVNRLRTVIPQQLVVLANRILPLRGRRWEWIMRNDDSGCRVLQQSEPGTDTDKKKLCGQRGLSMERLEQLEELRRRFQSLNRALQHVPGAKSEKGKQSKGRELPDPCPDILEKTDQLREQRVNQTAHLILAQALGVRLRAPQKDSALRERRNIHGEYESFRPPVDFIVLEDLSRYLSSQGRARSENSRLMKWCHRAILLKLKQLCEPYGLKVLETNAAYSSRFCSRTGNAGFRAVELTPDTRSEFRWRKHLDRLEKAARDEIKLDREARVEAENVKRLFDTLERLNAGRKETGKPLRTLLAPIAGGPIFIPMRGQTMQADINAAINLGLRAIAAPDCHLVHVRIRTERNDKSLRVRTNSNREKVRWEGKNPEIEMNKAADLASLTGDRQPNFFPDPAEIADFDRAKINGLAIPFSSGRGLWATINSKQWRRVWDINDERTKKNWNFTPPSEQSKEEDNIPM